MQGRMKASSHPTGKGPSRSEKLQLGGVPPRVVVRQNCTEDVKLQLGGVPPRVVVRQNCTEDVKCHAPQISYVDLST